MDSPYILFHFILFTINVSKNKEDLLLFWLIWINKMYFFLINYVELIPLDSTEDQILNELLNHEPCHEPTQTIYWKIVQTMSMLTQHIKLPTDIWEMPPQDVFQNSVHTSRKT